MNSFEHCILTRFNVKLGWLNKYGESKSRGLDPDWLNDRFKLFEQFCYPSLHCQTNQQFKWLVFFDVQTPELFKEKISKYAEWKNFIPIYVDYFEDKVLRESLLQNIGNETNFLITTRVDNDDALRKTFVESIQKNFFSQEFEFINFVNGYVLSLANLKLYALKHLSSPFASLIERRVDLTSDGFKTVLCEDHGKLSEVGAVKQINAQPAWIQIVHGNNVINSTRGLRQPIARLKDDFKIAYQLSSSENSLDYWVDKVSTLAYATARMAKVRVVMGRKGIYTKERLFNKFF